MPAHHREWVTDWSRRHDSGPVVAGLRHVDHRKVTRPRQRPCTISDGGSGVEYRQRTAILVVIDGLRPDAIRDDTTPVLHRMMGLGWVAGSAVTVRPSVTVAALTSLGTGVSPGVHGMDNQSRWTLPRFRGLQPLPGELRRHGVETTVVTPELPGSVRWLAGALLRLGGVARLKASASEPTRLVDTALHTLDKAQGPAFVVAYLNDADLAGHAWGWMSPAYLQAAGAIDRSLAGLMSLVSSPEHLVVITADHGGGGVLERDHDHPHPLNDAIPLLLLGGRVVPGRGGDLPAHLLDVPPTVLHHFGAPTPPSYRGRVLEEAFTAAAVCG